MNAKKLVTLTLLMLATTQTIYVSLCGHPNKLTSARLTNPVYIDGDVTDSKEWIDANSMELKIGTNYGRSPPFLETEIWAKNDMTHLYLLYRIKYPFTEYDLDDKIGSLVSGPCWHRTEYCQLASDVVSTVQPIDICPCNPG